MVRVGGLNTAKEHSPLQPYRHPATPSPVGWDFQTGKNTPTTVWKLKLTLKEIQKPGVRRAGARSPGTPGNPGGSQRTFGKAELLSAQPSFLFHELMVKARPPGR